MTMKSPHNNAAKALLWLLALLVPAQPSLASVCLCGEKLQQTSDSQSGSTSRESAASTKKSHCGCCHKSAAGDQVSTKSAHESENRKPCGCPPGCVCQQEPMPQCPHEAIDLRPCSEKAVARLQLTDLHLLARSEALTASIFPQAILACTTLVRCSQLCRFLV